LAEVAAERAQLLDKTGFDHGSWISLSKKTKTIVQNGI
jgi:aromatic ring-opening dioxygenase catalytic subunit (LigB family)